MKDSDLNVRFDAAFLVDNLVFLDVGKKQFDSNKKNIK